MNNSLKRELTLNGKPVTFTFNGYTYQANFKEFCDAVGEAAKSNSPDIKDYLTTFGKDAQAKGHSYKKVAYELDGKLAMVDYRLLFPFAVVAGPELVLWLTNVSRLLWEKPIEMTVLERLEEKMDKLLAA